MNKLRHCHPVYSNTVFEIYQWSKIADFNALQLHLAPSVGCDRSRIPSRFLASES